MNRSALSTDLDVQILSHVLHDDAKPTPTGDVESNVDVVGDADGKVFAGKDVADVDIIVDATASSNDDTPAATNDSGDVIGAAGDALTKAASFENTDAAIDADADDSKNAYSDVNMAAACNVVVDSASDFSTDAATDTISNEVSSSTTDNLTKIVSDSVIYAATTASINKNTDSKENNLDEKIHGEPSKVIHFRNLPIIFSQEQIVSLVKPYGRAVRVVMIKSKPQALVEMAEKASAIKMIFSCKKRQIIVHGRRVYIQFSRHTKLNAGTIPRSEMMAPLFFINSRGKIKNFMPSKKMNFARNTRAYLKSQKNPSIDHEANSTNPVVKVVVERVLHPVTLELLHRIFKRFGNVLKIITFTRTELFQALIQYSDAKSVARAIASVDGRCMYSGCCTLRVGISNYSSLEVQYNNAKSRDYTNPDLPAGKPDSDLIPTAGGFIKKINPILTPLASKDVINALVKSSTALYPLCTRSIAASIGGQLNNKASVAINSNSIKPLGGQSNKNASFATNSNSLKASVRRFERDETLATIYNSFQSKNRRFIKEESLPVYSSSFQAQGSNLNKDEYLATNSETSEDHKRRFSKVLLVSNLNTDLVDIDGLFTLFGAFGDVVRIKILPEKKHLAFIEMEDPKQVNLAIFHLDKARVWRKPIRVSASSHRAVDIAGDRGDGYLSCDYTDSPLHRFKKRFSKNAKHVYAPSATLHLSNIPMICTEEEVREVFTENGFKIKEFKFFPHDPKMALIQLSTVEEGIKALIKMHNYKIGQRLERIRVSFSRSKDIFRL